MCLDDRQKTSITIIILFHKLFLFFFISLTPIVIKTDESVAFRLIFSKEYRRKQYFVPSEQIHLQPFRLVHQQCPKRTNKEKKNVASPTDLYGEVECCWFKDFHPFARES